MVLLLGGVPVSDEVSEGGTKILRTLQGGGIHFLHTQKKKQNKSKNKITLSRNSPAAVDAPFARFAPAGCCPEKLPAPWGVPIFDTTPRVGVPKFYGLR